MGYEKCGINRREAAGPGGGGEGPGREPRSGRDHVLSWLREFDRALQAHFTVSIPELLKEREAG